MEALNSIFAGIGNLVDAAANFVNAGGMTDLRSRRIRFRGLTVRQRQLKRARGRARDKIARKSRRYNLRTGAAA